VEQPDLNRSEPKLPPYLPPLGSMLKELEEISVNVREDELFKVVEFTRLLVERSPVVNLMGPGERDRLWSRHVLESFCYSRLLDRSGPVVDIGTGNGFPGIVLASMGFEVIMLEPRRKRYLFLRFVLDRLSLEGSTVDKRRLEDLEGTPAPCQYTARSVAPAMEMLGSIAALSGPGSTLVVREPVIRRGRGVSGIVELKVPPLDRSGFLVQYRV